MSIQRIVFTTFFSLLTSLLPGATPVPPSVEAFPLDKFTAEGLSFEALLNDETSRDRLRAIIHPDNKDVTSYGSGLHASLIEGKLKIWGDRAASGNRLRCFFVFDESNNSLLGYVNLGTSGLPGDEILEGGFLFKHTVPEGLIAKAIRAVYVGYLDSKLQSGELKASQFIYTMHTTNRMVDSMESAGFLRFNPEKLSENDVNIANCLEAAQKKATKPDYKPRFLVNDGFFEREDGEYKKKELFFRQLLVKALAI